MVTPIFSLSRLKIDEEEEDERGVLRDGSAKRDRRSESPMSSERCVYLA